MKITDEKALLIIYCSALFHDVWDDKYIKNINHINSLKDNLRTDLLFLDLNNSDIDDIYTIIDNISFTKELKIRLTGFNLNLGRLSLYRNIVSDADKIESLGEKGIERIFIYQYNIDNSKNIYYYINIIQNIYYSRFNILINHNYITTYYGKLIAKPLIDQMETIINNNNILYNIALKHCNNLIFDFDNYNINNIIHKQKLDICVVSFGGCASNQLVDTLQKNGYNCRTPIWCDILCHSPNLINTNIPIIYIYRDPVKAFLSMKRRNIGFWDVNQRKLSNNKNIKLSDDNLLNLMIKQFYIWISSNLNNLLILEYSELFNNDILYKLSNHLNNTNLKHFPIQFSKTVYDITYFYNTPLFCKYKNDIQFINNFKQCNIKFKKTKNNSFKT